MWKQPLIRSTIFPPPAKWGMWIFALIFISDSSILVAARVCLRDFSIENLKVTITCCSFISHLCSHMKCMRLQALVLRAMEPLLRHKRPPVPPLRVCVIGCSMGLLLLFPGRKGVSKLWKTVIKLWQPEVKNKCCSQQLSKCFRQFMCQFTVPLWH